MTTKNLHTPNDGAKPPETPTIGVVLATLDDALRCAISALPGLKTPGALPHNLHVAVRAASDVRSLLEMGGEAYDPINVKAALDVLASGVQDADMQREIRVLRNELGLDAPDPKDAESLPCRTEKPKPVDDSDGPGASPARGKPVSEGGTFDPSGRFDLSTTAGTKAWEADFKHRKAIAEDFHRSAFEEIRDALDVIDAAAFDMLRDSAGQDIETARCQHEALAEIAAASGTIRGCAPVVEATNPAGAKTASTVADAARNVGTVEESDDPEDGALVLDPYDRRNIRDLHTGCERALRGLLSDIGNQTGDALGHLQRLANGLDAIGGELQLGEVQS